MSAQTGSRARTALDTDTGPHLRVNPIACDAHGMCAELLPELIVLDEWGYPVIGDEQVPAELLALAKQAVQSCPTRALLLERRQCRQRSANG
jgi:ferredoxin